MKLMIDDSGSCFLWILVLFIILFIGIDITLYVSWTRVGQADATREILEAQSILPPESEGFHGRH